MMRLAMKPIMMPVMMGHAVNSAMCSSISVSIYPDAKIVFSFECGYLVMNHLCGYEKNDAKCRKNGLLVFDVQMI